MRFIVTRTSIGGKERPCDEAVLGEKEVWGCRTVSEKEFNRKFSSSEGKWRTKGKNHKIMKHGCIGRMFGYEICWVLNIDSLEELMVFIKNHNDIVIFEREHDDYDGIIEIYDDRR